MVSAESCEFIDSRARPVHAWSTAVGSTAGAWSAKRAWPSRRNTFLRAIL
jgi:hypothetical protein